jgi:enterochelin esterase family protein
MRRVTITGCLAFLGSAMAAHGQPVSPWATTKTGTAAGSVQETSIHSRIYGAERRLWVYTPPGFDAKRATPYDLLVVFDGAEHLQIVPVPIILDNLLAAGRIAPMVAVLIDNGTGAARLADLPNRAQFADFVGQEVMPWAWTGWNATRDPKRTIVTGSSAGGLAAAYLAFRHPELFGNVLAQSPALWRGNEASNDPPFEWLTGQYKAAAKLPVTFWIEVGGRETRHVLGGSGPVFLEANRRFTAVLKKKGYTVEYSEIENAEHEPGHWRDHFADGILWLTARWERKAGATAQP